MSNPCINRWGLNALWHHYWYSDSKYHLNLQHDSIFLELLKIYLNYGNSFTSLFFWNQFWYKNSTKPARPNMNQFYRWLPTYSELLKTTSTYRYRIVSQERFDTRINVLKFNSWYVINFYWFQPDKGANRRRKEARLSIHANPLFITSRSNSALTKLTKLKTLTNSLAALPSQTYNF